MQKNIEQFAQRYQEQQKNKLNRLGLQTRKVKIITRKDKNV